jgi:uncharacterized protein
MVARTPDIAAQFPRRRICYRLESRSLFEDARGRRGDAPHGERRLEVPLHGFLSGAIVGLIGGLTSGLLGVSPGGGLVVFSVLMLGAEQHVAQGVSLVAQVPPTSLSGVRQYWRRGQRSPLIWFVLLGAGFLVGGVAGAKAAATASRVFLQWTYLFYLLGLGVLIVARPSGPSDEPLAVRAHHAVSPAALSAVGVFAGFSSGFLGIGGGLAMTVGLTAWLKTPRHEAQMVSLVLMAIPVTLPAAWVYWREGSLARWPVLIGVILGLVLGTDVGARLAHRVGDKTLRRLLIAFVIAMALFMANEALR